MKNLKFEILVDGTPRVAYVRPENKSKFLEKYQNNSPREVINAEELDYEIKFEKVNGLGKPQGTNLSQNNQQQNTELPSVDTSSESQEVVNLENVFKSTTKFGYKPFDNETLNYHKTYKVKKEKKKEVKEAEEEKKEIYEQALQNKKLIETLEKDLDLYNKYFEKYRVRDDGVKLTPQDFFKQFNFEMLDSRRKNEFEVYKNDELNFRQIRTLNGLTKEQWIARNAEKEGGTKQAEIKWEELSFLIGAYDLGLNYEDFYDTTLFQKNVFQAEIEKTETKIKIAQGNENYVEVDVIGEKKDIVDLPTDKKEGKEYDITYEYIQEEESKNISDAFDDYMKTTVKDEHAILMQELTENNNNFFDESKVLKNFKSRTIKRVNAEFKKESRKLEKILEEKLSPFRDKIIQELKEKYPNGHCDPEGKGFNLYDEDCYTDKELDEATEKLVEEEKRLIPLIPGYEELLEKKTERQNELLEKNASYRKFKLDQVEKGTCSDTTDCFMPTGSFIS